MPHLIDYQSPEYASLQHEKRRNVNLIPCGGLLYLIYKIPVICYCSHASFLLVY